MLDSTLLSLWRPNRDYSEHQGCHHEDEPEYKLDLEPRPANPTHPPVLTPRNDGRARVEAGAKQPSCLPAIETMKLPEDDTDQHEQECPDEHCQIVSAHRFAQEHEGRDPKQHPEQGVGHEPLTILNRRQWLPPRVARLQVEIAIKSPSPRFHDRSPSLALKRSGHLSHTFFTCTSITEADPRQKGDATLKSCLACVRRSFDAVFDKAVGARIQPRQD